MFFPNVFGAKNRGPKRSNLHTFVSSPWSLPGGQEIPGRECEASRCIKQGDKNTDEGNAIFLVGDVVVVVVVVAGVVVGRWGRQGVFFCFFDSHSCESAIIALPNFTRGFRLDKSWSQLQKHRYAKED